MMVSGEEVKQAVLAAGITHIPHHDCSICHELIGYAVYDGYLYFESGCGCSWSPPEPRGWEDAANWINMQTNEDVRKKLMKRFGFDSNQP